MDLFNKIQAQHKILYSTGKYIIYKKKRATIDYFIKKDNNKIVVIYIQIRTSNNETSLVYEFNTLYILFVNDLIYI